MHFRCLRIVQIRRWALALCVCLCWRLNPYCKNKCEAWGAACLVQWKQRPSTGSGVVPGPHRRSALLQWGKKTLYDLASWCIYSQPEGPADGRSYLWTGGFSFKREHLLSTSITPWPSLYKCASARFKAWEQPQPTLEPGRSRGSDVVTTRESRKSVAAPQPISGKELDTIRTLPLPEQMFSRAAPHLHNRSAPLWRAQTDCVWHKSESLRSTQLATPAPPWLWSVLGLWIPPPKKGQFSCSSAAVGNRWEGSWMGRMLHRQSADSQQPLALSFLHFLRSAWSSTQFGEPFGWWTLGSLVLVQHPLISTEQCLLFWHFASSLLPSFLLSNAFTSGSLSTLYKHSYPSLLYKWGNRGTHFTSVSFYKCPSFGKLNLKQWMQLQPNFQ